MRSTRLCVFPVPAEASTSSVVSRSSRIRRRAAASGRSAVDGLAVFVMQLPEGGKHRVPALVELPDGALGRGLCATAYGFVIAETAVAFARRMRKHPGGGEVEEAL